MLRAEFAQNGWWHNDEWHRLQWENAEDAIGELECLKLRTYSGHPCALALEISVLAGIDLAACTRPASCCHVRCAMQIFVGSRL